MFWFFAKVLKKDPWVRKRYTVPEYCFSGAKKQNTYVQILKKINKEFRTIHE